MDPRLQRLLQSIDRATRGMTAEQLRWPPQQGKWCAAEILEHLSITYGSTAGALRKLLKAGQPTATPPTLRQRLTKLMVVTAGHFPRGRKAPPFTVPRGLDADQVLREVRQNLIAMDELLRECERRFGRVKLANHPVLGALSVPQWCKFHWVHGRHHLRQIERLRRLQGVGRS